ncbi:hypothetical protein ACFQS1_19795 [Paractinoplanes rhizophilus]|uniref:Uncharacterized protein n=1 Tax=Paractinoplanes rhizophilus TaxID=1416877 RepID=A0ABW2HVS3_9ACTN
MGRFVIKPDRDVDFYVGWSTIVESIIWWGPRAEVLAYLAEDAPADPPEERLARADLNGSSAYNYKIDGGWEDEGFTYEQRGWLPRSLLVAACEALERDDEPAVWDLLEPFEEGMEVRRG